MEERGEKRGRRREKRVYLRGAAFARRAFSVWHCFAVFAARTPGLQVELHVAHPRRVQAPRSERSDEPVKVERFHEVVLQPRTGRQRARAQQKPQVEVVPLELRRRAQAPIYHVPEGRGGGE